MLPFEYQDKFKPKCVVNCISFNFSLHWSVCSSLSCLPLTAVESATSLSENNQVRFIHIIDIGRKVYCMQFDVISSISILEVDTWWCVSIVIIRLEMLNILSQQNRFDHLCKRIKHTSLLNSCTIVVGVKSRLI